MSLLDKLRAARQFSLEADGHTFTLRRPTDAEALALGEATGLDLVRRFVTGWDLREIDLVPGGDPVQAQFDAQLWDEWVADQPQLWAPLSDAILKAYVDHRQAREDAAKN